MLNYNQFTLLTVRTLLNPLVKKEPVPPHLMPAYTISPAFSYLTIGDK